MCPNFVIRHSLFGVRHSTLSGGEINVISRRPTIQQIPNQATELDDSILETRRALVSQQGSTDRKRTQVWSTERH